MLENILISILCSGIWDKISHADFFSQMEKTYQSAIVKYSKGKKVTNRLILRDFPTWQQLQQYVNSGGLMENYLREFINIWENELRNNPLTYNYLFEDIVKGGIENIHHRFN